nr:MAG TPA: hypothetical protein [Caudoviricetes sp.]
MALIKWYYDIVSKRLIGSYIFFTEGRNALYGDERFYNLFNFKMVSSPNFLLRWFDSSRRLMAAKNKFKKTIYYWFSAGLCSRLAFFRA